MERQVWRVAVTICAILLVSGCSTPASEDQPAVQTAIAATSTAEEIASVTRSAASAQTRTAMPSRTPRPTATRDTRSAFEKCVQAGRGIRYVISGERVDTVFLAWVNDTGGTEMGTYKVPFCAPYSGFRTGDFLYISAQIDSGGGRIQCRIYDGVQVIAEGSASGFASITTCSGSAR